MFLTADAESSLCVTLASDHCGEEGGGGGGGGGGGAIVTNASHIFLLSFCFSAPTALHTAENQLFYFLVPARLPATFSDMTKESARNEEGGKKNKTRQLRNTVGHDGFTAVQ